MATEIWTAKSVSSALPETRARLSADLARLGQLSGEAQGLNGPITSLEKLLSAENQTVLVRYSPDGTAVAFLKFGRKSLYLYDPHGRMANLEVDCLLDFFCVEEERRQGIGLQLFRSMLSITGLEPCRLAYDRPSPLLISFMKKHFQYSTPDIQPNRFAIFQGFWG